MAKATVNHTCGHTGSVTERNRREADRRAAYLSQQDCWECRKAAESAAAAQASQDQGLPALTGTPKQVAWAESLRQRVLVELEKNIAEMLNRQRAAAWASAQATRELEDALALIATEIRCETDSKAWIERITLASVQDYALVAQMHERHLCPTLEAETAARRAARPASGGEAV